MSMSNSLEATASTAARQMLGPLEWKADAAFPGKEDIAAQHRLNIENGLYNHVRVLELQSLMLKPRIPWNVRPSPEVDTFWGPDFVFLDTIHRKNCFMSSADAGGGTVEFLKSDWHFEQGEGNWVSRATGKVQWFITSWGGTYSVETLRYPKRLVTILYPHGGDEGYGYLAGERCPRCKLIEIGGKSEWANLMLRVLMAPEVKDHPSQLHSRSQTRFSL